MRLAAVLLGLLVFIAPSVGLAQTPDCSSWPTMMALVHLKNAALADPAQIDASHTKAILLASEKKGKDLFRQVYNITFQTRSGKSMEVITRSDASQQECSMGGVDVYVVSRKLGP